MAWFVSVTGCLLFQVSIDKVTQHPANQGPTSANLAYAFHYVIFTVTLQII